MTRYELMVILDPEVQEEELTGAVDRVKQSIANRGGTDEETEIKGRRRLAYPIRNKRDGTMVVSRFEMPGAEVKELTASLRTNDAHLRTFLTRI